METDTEAEELRCEIAMLATHPKARRYSPALRARVTAWATTKVAAGASVVSLCERLGLGEPTLHKFLGRLPSGAVKKSAGFKRVKLAGATVVERVVMRGPCGSTVDGLSLEGIAELFRRLACSV